MAELHVEKYQKLYAAVGQMTIRWAGLEMATDRLVASIFQFFPDEKGGFPQALNRKIKFLRNSFRTHHPLRDLAADAEKLVDRINQAASDRKWIIHGVVGDLDEFEQSGRLRVGRTAYRKTIVAMEHKTLSVADIDGYSIQFLIMMNETNRLADATSRKLKKPNL